MARESKKATLSGIEIVEDTNAPLMFVEALLGGGPAAGDNVNLVFGRRQFDHSVTPPKPYIRTALRIVMPRSGLAGAVEFIARLSNPDTVEPLTTSVQ